MKMLRFGGLLCLALAVCIGDSRLAKAVVIHGSDTANSTAPADDPGFANVGTMNGATGVYLGTFSGQSWVLTADHVGGAGGGPGTTISQVTLGGTNYNVLRGIQISSPGNIFQGTDLDLLQINYTGPALPTLSISATAPAVGSQVVMIGDGFNRASADNYWAPDWTDQGTNSTGSMYQGYKFANPYSQTMRWGTNNLAEDSAMDGGVDDLISYGFGPVLAGHTTFSKFNNLSPSDPTRFNEAQVVGGDSGGAVFYKNGGNWELAGTIVTMGIQSGQTSDPNIGAYYPVFGDYSYFVDLSQYRSVILADAGLSTWSGGGGDNKWSTSSNWNTTPIDGNSLLFTGSTRLSNTNENLTSVGAIMFDSSAGAFVLSGNGLTISNGITNNSTSTQTINLSLTLSAIQQFYAASGALQINGAITTSGKTVTVAGSFNTTFAGNVSGAGALIKTGAGTLSLLTNNSFSGGTTVNNNGTLIVGAPTALGTGGLAVNNTAIAKISSGVGTVVLGTVSGGLNNLQVNAGSATPTAKFDIGKNSVVIPYSGSSPFNTIRTQILYAADGGAWDRAGITDSSADGATYGLGYAEAGDVEGGISGGGTYVNNQSPKQSGANTVISNKAVILKHTYLGDTDLNGIVDSFDYNNLTSNFGITSGATWTQGDNNYDGTVDGFDYNNLTSNLGSSGLSDSAPAAVPEPSSLVLIAFSFAILGYRPVRVQLMRNRN